nr:hypothetical protein [Mycoplasmopsis bovis]
MHSIKDMIGKLKEKFDAVNDKVVFNLPKLNLSTLKKLKLNLEMVKEKFLFEEVEHNKLT